MPAKKQPKPEAPFDRFTSALKKVLSVSKQEVVAQERAEAAKRKRRRKK